MLACCRRRTQSSAASAGDRHATSHTIAKTSVTRHHNCVAVITWRQIGCHRCGDGGADDRQGLGVTGHHHANREPAGGAVTPGEPLMNDSCNGWSVTCQACLNRACACNAASELGMVGGQQLTPTQQRPHTSKHAPQFTQGRTAAAAD